VVTMTVEDRLIEQMAPIGELLQELIEAAQAKSTVQHAAASYPQLRRDAHLSRVSGIVCWALVADGLVEAARQGRFPTGFSVATTDAQHNAGRYAFTFPGGVFTVRREPHDDEKDEGLFMQESFKEVTDLLDQQGAPDDMRVWIKIAPADATKLTALDRHKHWVKVYLTDLLTASVPPTTLYPGSSTQRTQVRSTRKPEQDSAAE